MATLVTAPTAGTPQTFGWFNTVSTAVTELQAVVPWIPLAFRSPWTNYGTYEAGGYRKIDDTVQLRGLISRNSASGNTIADLPVGYRLPTAYYMFCVATGEPNAYGRLDIYNDGQIYITSLPTSWVNLSGIQFSIRT
jgi:hypothetical protein